MGEIIFDIQRFSNFSNSNNNILISGTNDKDSITNSGSNVTIKGGAGNDSIENGEWVYDEVNNDWKYIGDSVTIDGGDGADTIANYCKNVSIAGGAGNDSIHNYGDSVTIDSGDGNDQIDNYSSKVTIKGGKGNDSIDNSSNSSVSIDCGEGNDYTSGYLWYNVSVTGGKGNDTIGQSSSFPGLGNVFIYNEGDGNDVIEYFGETDTLLIPNGTWTTKKGTGGESWERGEDNIIVTVGKGKITLKGAASLKAVNIVSSAKDIHPVNVVDQGVSDTYSSLITGINYRDSISNSYFNVTIKTGNGSDSIYNGGSNVSIDAGADDDNILSYGSGVTIDGGVGNDGISNGGFSVTIDGGAGNDTIDNSGDSVTIDGGAGNDLISLKSQSENILIVYNNGDGNDTVYGYNVSDTINLKDDSVTGTSISGNSLILKTSSGGSIRFVNTKSVNVNGTVYGDISTNGTSGNDNITNFAANTTIDALGGNDKISNSGENVLIKTNAGKNNIKNYGAQSTITTGSDNDTIYNRGSNTKINSGAGNDSVANYASDVTIDGGAGKNSLESFSAKNVSMVGGDGNDYIGNNDGENVTINGGDGNDSIYNSGNSTVDAGEGDDEISNSADNVSISMGDGNDYFSNNSDNVNVTVLGGKGNDTFSNYYSAPMGTVYVYKKGDGNDLINDLSDNDTILISDSKWTTAKSGEDIIVTVGTGNITLKNAASLSAVNIVSSATDIHPVKIIDNDKSNTVIKGTNYSDRITNSTFDALSNDKELKNVTINSGAGNDSIYNDGTNVSISGGAGNDSVHNSGDKVTIDGGAGNDYIYSNGSSVTVDAGAGNDYIYSYGEKVTINAGAGNDTINIYYFYYGDKVLFKYADGDGNDLITGFNETSTLNISGSSYSTAKSGNNVIVTVGNGKITLDGAASLQTVNIVKEDSATNTWKLDGTTATYGTSSKTLVTVKGVKSTEGLSIKGKVVTVAKSSLNNSNVTVSNGYTLALASDVVKKATTTKPSWSYKDSVATYAQTTSAYYALAGNKKSITYKKATSKTLATVSGVKSKDGIKVSGKVITVPNKIINKNTTVNGNGYEFKLAAGNTSITGSGNVDKITNSGAKVTIGGGKGNDIISLASGAKNNMISYSNNDGNDIIYGFDSNDALKISGTAKVTTSGADVVFTVGKGKITVKGAANKTFSYSDAGGNKTYSTVAPSPADSDNYTISNDGKGITLSGSYSSEEFDVTTVKNGGDKIVTIDASAITHKLKIKGNDLANSIIGGKGNDTLRGEGNNDSLTGGNGSDVFIYYDGDGNDVITDYEQRDTIVISGSVTPSTLRSDVVLKVGKGKITVQDAFEEGIGITYKENGVEHDYLNGEQTVVMNEKKTTATVTKNYWKDSFDFANFGKSIATVDATSFESGILIEGNDKPNKILGGSGKNTLKGGKGNDTLQGNSAVDVFVYNEGDGDDIIYQYSESDIISIASGTANYDSIKGSTVIFTVGTGKISVDGAAGKKITYYDENHPKGNSQIYGSEKANVAESWFVADDNNFEVTPSNNLSSLVQNNSVDCSFVNTLTKITKENNLIAYSGSKK